MHAAQVPARAVSELLTWTKWTSNAGLLKLTLAKKTREKAAIIAPLFEFDRIGAMKRRRNEISSGLPLASLIAIAARMTAAPAR